MIDLTGVRALAEPRADALRTRRRMPGPSTPRLGSYAPMRVAEIITVCMGKLIHELREFLPSARVAFPDVPIHVVTDDAHAVLEIAEANLVRNVIPVATCSETPDFSAVSQHSAYWQPEPIYFKLKGLLDRVVELPPQFKDGVMIVDCDVTFRAGFARPFFGDVALSPFYWGKRDITTNSGKLLQDVHGEFNAGMLVTRSVNFCRWWLDSYLAGFGGFYEQACLDAVPQRFCTDYISPLHNFGKWRFAKPYGAVRSYHQHLRERSYNADVGALKIAAQSAAANARKTLQEASNA
jgi:hypothetical protein